MANILIVSGGFYEDIADMLERGATDFLSRNGATFDIERVPGALEIPVLVSLAFRAGLVPRVGKYGSYDGVIALGCVIRGETTHYEIVSNDSCRALMELATRHYIPLGNGILTVENRDQALARLKPGENHKGEHAAEACLSLIEYAERIEPS